MIDISEILHFHLFSGLGREMGRTLLLAWSGETYALRRTPIWVRTVAVVVALSVAQESMG